MPMKDQASLIEDRIRTAVLSKRVRVSEFFKDYDRLRSGYVTRTRFTRCLDQSFGIILAPEDENCLLSKYNDKNDGMINYHSFANNIEQVFNPQAMTTDPRYQTVEPDEYLGTTRSVRPLSPAFQHKINRVLQSLAPYYKYHGINIRTSFEDFDKHNIGLVTESQFYRSFPRPPGLEESSLGLLARRYLDPAKPSMCNYLNLHHDLEKVQDQTEDTLFGSAPPTSYNIPREEMQDGTTQQIFNKIQVAVHKNGVRTTEFFKDHDKLRSGVITENQFTCGLMLCIGKEAHLTKGEVQHLVNFYKTDDGRVRYKDFCDLMENAFNEPHLEKKPEFEVVRPPLGALSRTLNPLSEREEERIQVVLKALSEDVKQRRLMMIPYFKDFDRSKAYTRNVTKQQFGRILHFLSLNVEPEDLNLLCRKFEVPLSGDINYPAFVQSVDNEFIGFTMESGDKQRVEDASVLYTDIPVDSSNVDIEHLKASIRHFVLTNRIRVCEYFQDFDSLRGHSIPRSQFIMGLTSLGMEDITKPECKALCDHYANPKKTDQVLWKLFEKDIETAFTQVLPNLEKTPTSHVPPHSVYLMKKPGTMDWSTADLGQVKLVDEAMERMQQRANQRRVLTKPCFQDFDPHNLGIVTNSQFRQCLTYLGLTASEFEMSALESKYSNNMGFNYVRFLEDLQPSQKPELKYTERLEVLRKVNSNTSSLEQNPLTDFESIMTKIKTKVSKQRIRVLEFMRDYDKLRTGRMLKTLFQRALDLANLGLLPTEVDVLATVYECPTNPDCVQYLLFSDEIESIFTLKNLEKAPEVTPTQFIPPVEVDQNILSPEAEAMLMRTMRRLAEKVRQRRIQLFPLFEDYDRVHNGTVSGSQLIRVLSELDLGSLVNNSELCSLCEKFNVKVGGKHDVDYIAFCNMIYQLAKFEVGKP
ncbi:uncharacterized protein [Antedon mediterranea]|uniref:uncharacterized protein n=1 Tax=Antedon mediterranea TaxID=105859 RepID=UPI003AF45913